MSSDNSSQLRKAPEWPAVFRAQLSVALGLSTRTLLAFFFIVAVQCYFMVEMYRRASDTSDIHIMSFMLFIPTMGIVAASLPFVIWKDEGPNNRNYLFGLPSSFTKHSLIRVGSGLPVLWSFFIISVLVTLGVQFVTEAVLSLPHQNYSNRAISLFGIIFSLTSTYLLTSVIALLSKRPWVTLILIYLSFQILIGALAYFDKFWIIEALGELISGKFGLIVQLPVFTNRIDSSLQASLVWLPVGILLCIGAAWIAPRLRK